MTKTTELVCCELNCTENAEFEIYDNLDVQHHLYATQACVKHVGELLGNMQHVDTDGKTKAWTVIELKCDSGPCDGFEHVPCPRHDGSSVCSECGQVLSPSKDV